MEALEFFASNSFINLFPFMTSWPLGREHCIQITAQQARNTVHQKDDSVILYKKESDRKEVKVG